MLKMYRFLLIASLLFTSFLAFSAQPVLIASRHLEAASCEDVYTDMGLKNIVNYSAFKQAFTGYNKIKVKSKEIMTVIDFTKPSTEERLYVIDMKNKRLLFKSHVSHGKNSGDNYATSFSNQNGSFKSSLGFYLTENTYIGKNGYSLILNGLERGINDKAKERAIVIHGADYANPSTIKSSGRLGRSLGCPALPQAVSRVIINTIKDGTLLYIYANNRNYLSLSDIISGGVA
ncbi:MAG: hypothetical protein RL662_394 [Bacteroidota bacterium]|jgi:hypothetical protein